MFIRNKQFEQWCKFGLLSVFHTRTIFITISVHLPYLISLIYLNILKCDVKNKF
jgi:hypothetical protein